MAKSIPRVGLRRNARSGSRKSTRKMAYHII